MSHEILPSLASLEEAVSLACNCTYVPRIEQGRLRVLLMPKDWVRVSILAAASNVLDPNDDWAFRRLLELLSMVCPELVSAAVSQGLTSTNPEIQEAAVDFSDEKCIEECRRFTQSLAESFPELRAHLQSLN